MQLVGGMEAFGLIKDRFDRRTGQLRTRANNAGRALSNVFRFCEDVYGEGQEILILVTELTISRYGCKEYFAHNKELLFYERQKEIIRKLDNLDLNV